MRDKTVRHVEEAGRSRPRPRAGGVRRIARRTFRRSRAFLNDFLDDDPFQLAAATSYYTLLSLTPLVMIAIAAAGLWFDHAAVQEQFLHQVHSFIGADGAQAIRIVMDGASERESSSFFAVGIVSLLIGSSTVFVQIQSALNRIWDVEARPRRSAILDFVRHRLLSFGMVLAVGFLLVVSLVLSAALSALVDWVHGSDRATAIAWQILDHVTSWLLISVLFAAMFKFLPDVRLAWRHVVFGAGVTGALFSAGKYAIGAYLAHGAIGSSFGAAGSVVVLTVWVYYAALIFYLGAEITHVRAKRARAGKVDATFAVSRPRYAPSEHGNGLDGLTR